MFGHRQLGDIGIIALVTAVIAIISADMYPKVVV
jgi:hypothetical protein